MQPVTAQPFKEGGIAAVGPSGIGGCRWQFEVTHPLQHGVDVGFGPLNAEGVMLFSPVELK
jgi:hypothetical protein